VARQNFQHSKRQRDLAKKQKREEKAQRKAERKRSALEQQQAPAVPMPDEPQTPS
jgi:hypothetical protein